MSWSDSIEEAKQVVAENKEPFAIYFSDPIFFIEPLSDESFAALKQAGIHTFVKVVCDESNAAICKKYSAESHTLVLCAPSGEKISSFVGEKCSQSDITTAMKTFKAEFETYMKNHAEQNAKAKETTPTKPNPIRNP